MRKLRRILLGYLAVRKSTRLSFRSTHSKISTAAALFVLTTLAPASQAQNITYAFHQAIGQGSVTGTIQTDGTTGVLGNANILNWSINLNGVGSTYKLTPSQSFVGIAGSDLTATAKSISFNFSGTDGGYFHMQANSPGLYSGYHYFCENTTWYACAQGAAVSPDYAHDATAQYQTESGSLVLATVGGSISPIQTSINSLAQTQIQQMLLTQLESQILLGRNEQVSCGSCGGVGGTFGSAYIGPHGRYALNREWTLLGGAQIGESAEGASSIDLDLGFSAAIQYDPAHMGKSRPYAEAGLFYDNQKLTYNRSYLSDNETTTVTAVGHTRGNNVGIFAQAGWVDRLTRRDEAAASLSYSRLWQRVGGYTEQASDSQAATVTDTTNVMDSANLNFQYTHLFGTRVEANANGGVDRVFHNHSGLQASISGSDYSSSQADFYYYPVGGRVGVRLNKKLTLDLYVDGVVDPAHSGGSSVHGGSGLRWGF